MELILGSSSPNRRALFDRLGVAYRVVAPAYDEIDQPGLTTSQLVAHHAQGKAQSVRSQLPPDFEGIVLGFDSMISHRGQSIGKAKDQAAMVAMITAFAGQEQQIITGMCVMHVTPGSAKLHTSSTISTAQFRSDITADDLAAYAKFNDWSGKCGAWSVLGSGLFLVDSLSGSFQNIVGVPVTDMRKAIEQLTGQSIFAVLKPKPL